MGLKSKAGSNSANCRLRPHFTIHLYCGITDLRAFLLLRVTDQTDFYIAQIEAHGKYF